MNATDLANYFQGAFGLTSSQAALLRTSVERHFVPKSQVAAVVNTVCSDTACAKCHGAGEFVVMQPTTQIGSVYTCFGPHAAFGGAPVRYVYPEGFPKHLQYQPKPAVALNISVAPAAATIGASVACTLSAGGEFAGYVNALDGQPFIVACPSADTPIPSAT